ncbi:EAL domain-containing protein [Cohaesibacter gelatinilyticus]|uniref:cyclic-guanylate-specific phosphodiesterase n=1 Tax=Cohaesibacter gelatinilyticus TaxID=372072 RepID=A0A285NEU5_9HYPH|nr:EAL domain-containing protein [Cohaesibacter gelatinilyticus]SNZ08022.1 EAL domain, c-di-GMP-specific phosphodiesterase class I (or its enzymatically inactive variant) [Cohaesibacter gelatinilyticus]
MIRNAKKIAAYMMAGVAGVAVLTFAAQSMLMWQGKRTAEADMQTSAQLMLDRASHASMSAIGVLDRLAQTTGLSCTTDHRFLLSDATRAVPWVDTIGLVDRNGNLVCTDIGQSSRQSGLLPNYQANAPEISLSLSGNEVGKLSLLVVRHISNGRRLVARVPGELLVLDPVRNDLRRYRTAMLSLGKNSPLYLHEPIQPSQDVAVSVRESSDYLPFEASISIPSAAVKASLSGVEKIINLFGLALGLAAIGAGYALGRYRPDEGDKILDALDNGEFEAYLQPIVDLNNGQISGCEVLARWNRPGGGSVLPHDFIPTAERFDLTREITCAIFEDARDLIAPIVDAGSDFKISFNLFSRQLADDSILSDIRHVFEGSQIAYENLVFEISDRVPLNDTDQAKRIIKKIQELGSQIAIDDVGAGHSGLYSLTEISVDILKLDKILVDSLKRGLVGAEVVNSLIELACSLDIGVVAEGVETEDQVEHLKKLGVSTAQGYLFSPALPGNAFVDLVMASRSQGKIAKAPAADDDDNMSVDESFEAQEAA